MNLDLSAHPVRLNRTEQDFRTSQTVAALGIYRAAYARSVGDPRFEEVLRSLMVAAKSSGRYGPPKRQRRSRLSVFDF